MSKTQAPDPVPVVDLRKIAEQAGISMDCWEMGAASLAHSEGVHGITREHLERFAALYGFACWNAALAANPPNMQGFVGRALDSIFPAPEGAQPMPDNVMAGAVCTVAEARGYVAFGAGVYRVQETVEPGLVVTFRRDGEQSYAVGARAPEADPTPIPSEDIIVRLQFTSAAGLDSLEHHLRSIRAQHWPETVTPHVVKHCVTHDEAGAVTKVEAIMSDASVVTVVEVAPAPSPAEGDGMLEPLIYAAIMHHGTPKTVADFERAAANVADMLQRRAASAAPASDGYKVVPVQPTTHMQVAGFESEAWDELSSAVLKRKGWPYSCRESAECVSAIYAAMIQAAPTAPIQCAAVAHATGRWTVISPDGKVFTAESAHRAANEANKHLRATDPVEAKKWADMLDRLRAENEAENERLLAEHGTLDCPACGGSGHIGDVDAPGMVLVPTEPTEQMLLAGGWGIDSVSGRSMWRDMLAAAKTQPPVQPMGDANG